jgi:hypothetical protein
MLTPYAGKELVIFCCPVIFHCHAIVPCWWCQLIWKSHGLHIFCTRFSFKSQAKHSVCTTNFLLLCTLYVCFAIAHCQSPQICQLELHRTTHATAECTQGYLFYFILFYFFLLIYYLFFSWLLWTRFYCNCVHFIFKNQINWNITAIYIYMQTIIWHTLGAYDVITWQCSGAEWHTTHCTWCTMT